MTLALRRLSVETYVIALIAIVDLIATILLIQGERAYEGNPLMNFYLSHGVWPFIAAKILFTAMPLLILEWARRRRPDFVRRLSRVAIAGYLGMYGIMFARINMPTLLAERHEPPAWSNINEGLGNLDSMRAR